MNEQNVNLNERITFKTANVPQIALLLIVPIELIGVCVFLVYMVTHWHTFVGQSAAFFTWLAWFAGLVMYTALAWLMVKVLRSFIDAIMAFVHAGVDAYHKLVETRAIRTRRELLHTHDTYVVYLQNGKITVHEIARASNTRAGEIEMIEAVEAVEADSMPALPSPILTFRELLQSGIVQAAIKEGKMILGYVGGVLRYGTWLDLYSAAIGGVSGSGKTTTVRFLLFQAILAGARLIMIDPHINEPEESLAAQFKAFKNIHVQQPCDDNPAAVEKRVQWLMREYKRRESRGIKGPPLVFVLDEFNAIIRKLPDELRKELARLLLDIAQEGRKFGIFALLIGQRWSEQDLGGKNLGAAIRSSLASQLAHRFTDEDQAKKLIGGRNGARCLELEQGHYLYRDTQGALTEMVTPFTDMDDGAYIQRLLDGENTPENIYEKPMKTPEIAGSMEPLRLLEFRSEKTEIANEQAVSVAEKADLSEKARRVMLLQADGVQKPDIMRQIWGVNPGGSEDYKRAIAEYQMVMKFIAEKLGA